MWTAKPVFNPSGPAQNPDGSWYGLAGELIKDRTGLAGFNAWMYDLIGSSNLPEQRDYYDWIITVT